jgi:hypothetical protein
MVLNAGEGARADGIAAVAGDRCVGMAVVDMAGVDMAEDETVRPFDMERFFGPPECSGGSEFREGVLISPACALPGSGLHPAGNDGSLASN